MIDNNKTTQIFDQQINITLQQRLQQILTDLQLDDAPAGVPWLSIRQENVLHRRV